MTRWTVTAPRVITGVGAGPLVPGYVVASGGRITEVGAGQPPHPPDLALASGVLVPGLIDLQLNGSYGVELASADAAGWARLVTALPQTGTTAFLATFVTAPLAVLVRALRSAAAIVASLPTGARALGVHLEGPFLSPRRAGAHRREWLMSPTAGAVSELVQAGAGALRLLTLAPEADGALAAVAALVRAGVVVSLGHSDATAAQVAAAAGAGARMVTHLFNAQRPLHHREPGIIGQALTDQRLTCGLIADFHHVSPAVCALAVAAAPGRVCLVTDAAACAGLPPGRYEFAAGPVELPPGAGAAPVRPDGTLAGSGLRMDRALANAVVAGMSLPAAVAAATAIPAGLIGRPDLGRLAAGAAADLTWLGDDLMTRASWVGGRPAWPPAGPPHAG